MSAVLTSENLAVIDPALRSNKWTLFVAFPSQKKESFIIIERRNLRLYLRDLTQNSKLLLLDHKVHQHG